MIVVVMGAAGAGKSVVGEALAERLGAAFLEGDDYHPVQNRERMRGGLPLRDRDRWPWLDRLADELRAREVRGERTILACSALKRSYRERLRGGARAPRFVHLSASRELLEARVATRAEHFMPASLVVSQLSTLEPLGRDETGLTLDSEAPIDALVDRIAAWLGAEGLDA